MYLKYNKYFIKIKVKRSLYIIIMVIILKKSVCMTSMDFYSCFLVLRESTQRIKQPKKKKQKTFCFFFKSNFVFTKKN